MSSRTVEREIVQMEFDASRFNNGVQASMRSLSDFKKSFTFDGAQKSLSDIGRAIGSVDFASMQESVIRVQTQFNALGVVGWTVINKLTGAVLEFAAKAIKALPDALFITPAKTGLEEYETQLNAVQTILANTRSKGSTLEDVNAALDELNKYADLTIYNFTEMTSAIGRFTTAGVGLDESVQAIKGLSNVAAISGANAQEAARAQYQLSQAIASGTIRAQDWMSMENANIAGEAFKESIKETARVHGINIDQIIEKNGSFKLSLQENWLSADIMLETLNKFTGELTDDQLLAMGYTEEQIAGIQDMAATALDAATKIKTVTQMIDVMKEALQSGWSQTWRIILGDFEQAKELWGTVAEILGQEIETASSRRNALLSGWEQLGGRDSVIGGVIYLLKAGINILHVFRSAITDVFAPLKATRLVEISRAFNVFALKIKMASENADTFRRIVRGLAAIVDIVLRVLGAILKPILALVKTLFAGSGSILEWIAGLADLIYNFRGAAIKADLFNKTVGRVLEYLKELGKRILKSVDAFMELEIIQDITKWFRDLGREDLLNLWNGLLTVLKAIIAPFYLLGVAIRNLYLEFLKLEQVQKVLDYFRELRWEDVKNGFKDMGNSVKEFFDTIKNSEIFVKFVELVKTFDGRRINAFLDEAKERFGSLGEVIGSVIEKLKGAGGSVSDAAEGIDFAGLGEKIKNGIVSVLDWLIQNAQNIDYSAVFDAINTGLFAGLVLSIRNLASGTWLKEGLSGIFGKDSELGSIGASIVETLSGVQSTLTSYQNNIKADTLQKIAISIAIFAGALLLLTLIDTTKLQTASLVIAGMLATLFGSSAIMSKISTKDIAKTSTAIVALSISMAIAALALSKVSNLNAEQIKLSLAAMAVGLVGLVLAVSQISAGAGTLKNIAMLFALGIALNIIADVIAFLGGLKPEVISKGMMAMSISLGILTGAMVAIERTSKGNIKKSALAILGMAYGVKVLAQAVQEMGKMDKDVLIQGLISVGLVMAGFAAFSRLVDPKGMISAALAILIASSAMLVMYLALEAIGGMNPVTLMQGIVGIAAALVLLAATANAMTGALAGAAAMLVMSVAIIAIAVALKILGTLSIEELLISFAALAGVFAILAIAGLLMAPLVPVLMGLGVAMMLLGLGAALLGAGVFLAATGLVALAASSAAIAGAIAVVGIAIIEILPKLAEAIALALVKFITVIAENAPIIIDAFVNIIRAMITGITTLVPEIVVAILGMITAILQAIADALPDIIQAGFDILLAILQGIEDNIAEVVAAGLGIVTEFINGIADGLPDLVDSAFNLVLTFLEAIRDGVEEYMADIILAGIEIGVAILQGVTQAISEGIPLIKQAIIDLAREALIAMGLGFLISSPSKATYKIGQQVIQGLVNSIEDGVLSVRDAMGEIVKGAKESLEPMNAAIAEALNDSLEFNPVIKPILDLQNFKDVVPIGTNKFKGILVTPITDETLTDDALSGATGQKDPSGVTFIQNNYSPKALDSATIYRQTRTQVARLATRAFEQ